MDKQLMNMYQEYMKNISQYNTDESKLQYCTSLLKQKKYIDNLAFKLYLEASVELFKGNYELAKTKYQESIQNNAELPLAWNGIGSTYLRLNSYEEAEEAYKKAIKLDENYYTPWHNLGFVYGKQYRDNKLEIFYEKSIEAYKRALELNPSFRKAWYNIGVSYCLKSEYKEAETAYLNSIQLDPEHQNSWNNLGYVYLQLKNYQKAEEMLNKAILLDPRHSKAWHNLGIIYQIKQQYEKAEEAFNKAIEFDPLNTGARRDLGILYRDRSEFDKAEQSFDQEIELLKDKSELKNDIKSNDDIEIDKESNNNSLSESLFEKGQTYLKQVKYEEAYELLLQAYDIDRTNSKYIYWVGKTCQLMGKNEEARSFIEKNSVSNDDTYWKSKTKLLLQEIEATIKARGTSSFRDARYDELLKITEDIYKDSIENEKDFREFLKPQYKSSDKIEFEVLRRWNSYTPIIANNFHESKGGGYFINFLGLGIVIDPGFNFIENFKASAHSFDDIDMIFISHAHNDHTADLESILTLLYKYNNNLKREKETELVDAYKKRVGSEPNEAQIDLEYNQSSYRKVIHIYMTKSTFKKYTGMFDLFHRLDYKLHIVENGNSIEINNDIFKKKVKVTVIKAKHFDIVSDNSSVGFCFEFDQHYLLYTGDTGINEEIVEEYINLYKDFTKEKSIILLAHLGGFKKGEEDYNLEAYYKFYDNHLGRLGIAKLVDLLNPDICLISEFGEEFKNNRINIAIKYTQVFNDTKFIPCDIGLKMDLTDEIALANAIVDANVKKSKVEILRSFIDAKLIETVELEINNSLHYYNGNPGTVSSKEVLMALLTQYKSERNLS